MSCSEDKDESKVIAQIVGLLAELRTGRYDGQLVHDDNASILGPIISEVNALAQYLKTQEQERSKSNDEIFILDSLGIGIWKWDLVTNALQWDDNMYRLYGCSPKDFSGTYDTWENALSEETKAKAIEELKAAVNGGKSFDTTFQVVQKNTGRIQEIRTRAFLIKDSNGKPIKMWGINLDRSREAELEHRLKDSTRLLEQTGALAKVGGWELDLNTGHVTMTRQTQIIHEIDENYVPPKYSTGGEWYPPEVWPTVLAAVQSAMKDGIPYDLESPFITAKKRRIWVRIQGFPIVENGKVIKLQGTFQDITERKKSEADLEIYKAVLDNASDFVAIADQSMTPIYINPYGMKMLGLSNSDDISKTKIEEHYSEQIKKDLVPKIKECMIKDGLWSGETEFHNFKTSEIIPLSDTNFTVKSSKTSEILGYATIKRDIRESKRLASELRSQKEFLNSILENIPNIVLVRDFDRGLGFSHINRAGLKLLGLSLNQILGKNDFDFFPHEKPDILIKKDTEVFQSKKTLHIEKETIQTPSGTRWLETFKVPTFKSNGSPDQLIGISTDITEDLKVKAELELERIKSVRNSKLASLGEMAAGIAHEINNPLAIIAGTARVLGRFVHDADQLKVRIQNIENAAERIGKIVRSLRKFSRSEEKSQHGEHKLSDIISEALVLTASKSKRHSTPVILEIRSECVILCDEIEIEQVMVNLINNAIDAVVSLDDRWVKLEISDDEASVILRVRDSGRGIDPEIQKKLFQPFFTTKPIGQGTGLGLSICKGILDEHYATIEINAKDPHTCFEIRFPKNQVKNNAA